MSDQDAAESDEEGDATDVDTDDASDGDAPAEASLADIAAGVDVDDPEAVDADALDDDLVDEVAEADPETVATELAELRLRVSSLEAEVADREEHIDEVESQLARTKADFQNYKKRQQKRREEEKQRATEDLVERLLDVRDNLVRALEQDEDADIREGIEATLRQFDDELDRENVAVVEPEPGEAVDPQRHEVLLRVESDQPEGTVADVHRPGYEMAGKVIRTAQVTVSEGGDDGEEEDEQATEADGDEAGEADEE